MSIFASFVNWDEAACAGEDVHFFFDVEEMRQGNPIRKENLREIRSLCTSCPIWGKCLEWGFENERYGVWGGLTSQERDSFWINSKTEAKLTALSELKQYGKQPKEVMEHVRKPKLTPMWRGKDRDDD